VEARPCCDCRDRVDVVQGELGRPPIVCATEVAVSLGNGDPCLPPPMWRERPARAPARLDRRGRRHPLPAAGSAWLAGPSRRVGSCAHDGDERALAWPACFWDPWFASWGSRIRRHHAVQLNTQIGVSRPPWRLDSIADGGDRAGVRDRPDCRSSRPVDHPALRAGPQALHGISARAIPSTTRRGAMPGAQ
jgi:hypothetical protein